MRLAHCAGNLPLAIDEVADMGPSHRRCHQAAPDHTGVDGGDRHNHPIQQMVPQPRTQTVGDIQLGADGRSQLSRNRAKCGNADQCGNSKPGVAAKAERQQQRQTRHQIGSDPDRCT